MHRWFSVLLPAVLILFDGATLGAHDERPAPVVTLRIVPNDMALTITAHLPMAALLEANLPRRADRTLDTAALAGPLQLIARDLALTLDVAQSGQPLPFPTTSARLGADSDAVDVALTYVRAREAGPLTARLRAFRAVPDPIPVRAEFAASPDSTWTFLVTGAAHTVTLNPTAGQTLRQFLRRGAEAVIADRAAVFFVLALVFPWRRREEVQRHAAAWFAVLLCSAAVTAARALPASAAPFAIALAASTAVVAALIGLAGAAPGWLTALACLFGLAHGVSIGTTFDAVRAYAGAHALLGFSTFAVAMIFALAWLLLLFTAALDALRHAVRPLRAIGIAALIYACHGALHLLTDQIQRLATLTAWNPDRLLIMAVIFWVALWLVSGLAFSAQSRQSPA